MLIVKNLLISFFVCKIIEINKTLACIYRIYFIYLLLLFFINLQFGEILIKEIIKEEKNE